MAGGETLYTIAVGSPIVFVRGRTQVSSIQALLDGAAVTPTVGTYKLIAPDGQTVGEPAVTLGTTSTVSVLSTALDSDWPYGRGYTERWTLTLGGVARTVRRQAIVGLFELHPPVSELDLVAGEYPDLAQQLGAYGTTLQPYMDREWASCLRHLFRKGVDCTQITEPSDVYDWYRHETLARVFKALLGMQDNQRWRDLWTYHRDEAKAAKAGLSIGGADKNNDGVPDTHGRSAVARSSHPNVAPSRSASTPWRW